MFAILERHWNQLKKHQKRLVLTTALFTGVTYIILLLYVVNFSDLGFNGGLLCSGTISITATGICTLLWYSFKIPVERYASLTTLILGWSAAMSIYYAATSIPYVSTCPWTPFWIFIALTWVTLVILHKEEKKKRKNKSE